MLTPTRLRIFGFRGFRDVAEFRLDAPLTYLFGGNGSCKSSTLNAIEWALYGDECTGKQTGIRERLGWIIPNRHASVPNVGVELTVSAPGGIHVIRRRLRHVQGKNSLQRELELTLPDGRVLVRTEAEERLAALRQSSFRDFATTVYQHQESIRSLLTQEPRDRHDAIDRLLGLSNQRDLLGALDAARVRSRHKEIDLRFAELEEQIKTALTTRADDLAELQHEAFEAGMTRNELTAAAALQQAGAIAGSLQDFARAAGLALPELHVPGEWAGIVDFDKAVRSIVGQLRGCVPGIEEQQRLFLRQQALLTVQAALDDLGVRRANLREQAAKLARACGEAQEVEAKIVASAELIEAQQARLRQASAHAAVVNEAIRFLESTTDAEPPCPACGSKVPHLRGRLQQLWSEQLEALVHEITARIDELSAERTALQETAAQHRQLQRASDAIQETTKAVRGQVAEVLDRALTAEDDAPALMATELRAIEGRLQELTQAIQQRQQELDGIEPALVRLRVVRNYLHAESKKQVLARAPDSAAFKALKAQRQRALQFVEDVEAVKDAVAAAARVEAETKLTAAEQSIDRHFRQLSRHPAIQRLKLAVTADKRTHRNAYEVTDQDGNDLTPVLSQGDLNALALAIFLGLATAARQSVFGCILMDDPSQSLSTEHKKALAALLDEVAQHKSVIVATMDAQFHQYLTASKRKDRTEYQFGPWTPEGGPSIAMSAIGKRRAPRPMS